MMVLVDYCIGITGFRLTRTGGTRQMFLLLRSGACISWFLPTGRNFAAHSSHHGFSGASFPGWNLYEVLLIQGIFMFAGGLAHAFFFGMVWSTFS